MASPYDLQEQEQLAQIKHFWGRYGNAITWLLIVVLGAFAGWNGWRYWQQKNAVEAAALFDELDRAARANDIDRVKRVWSDIQAQAASAPQSHHAGLLAAQALHNAGALDEAKAALTAVVSGSKDEGVQAVARLRIASIDLQAGRPADALSALNAPVLAEFKGLFADRRGDVLLADAKTDEARVAYREAWQSMSTDMDYRRIVEAKLNALGVDPSQATP